MKKSVLLIGIIVLAGCSVVPSPKYTMSYMCNNSATIIEKDMAINGEEISKVLSAMNLRAEEVYNENEQTVQLREKESDNCARNYQSFLNAIESINQTKGTTPSVKEDQ